MLRAAARQVKQGATIMSRSSVTTGGRTFAAQPNLTRLPLPALADTCERYLESLEPLVEDAAKLEEYKAEARKWFSSEEAKKLQNGLEIRQKLSQGSWLETWWNDVAYMGYRGPVPVNVSYFYTFKEFNRPTRDGISKQAARSALIALRTAEFRNQVRSGVAEPETMRSKDGPTPICMHMYSFLFNTNRVPKKPLDEIQVHQFEVNNHVAVLHKGEVWEVPVATPEGILIPLHSLEDTFQMILDSEGSDDAAACAVGVLSSNHRDTWAEDRHYLIASSPQNAETVSIIEQSIVAICLDQEIPKEAVEQSYLHAPHNRYYDKSVQFVVGPEGRAGLNGEHSMMDGTVTQRLCDEVLAFERSASPGNAGELVEFEKEFLVPVPVCHHWNLESCDSLRTSIQKAEVSHEEAIKNKGIHSLNFTSYGKSLMKSLGISPDAYMQMSYQLAYERLTGKPAATYESASTRRFHHGRTETVRSCTKASRGWVEKMQAVAHVAVGEEPAAITRQGTPAEATELAAVIEKASPKSIVEAVSALKKAAGAHVSQMKRCSNGAGVDRHLLGLRLLASERSMDTPSIFEDPIFAHSCTWRLSTSQVSSPYFSVGFGAVVSDGFGICYGIQPSMVSVKVSSGPESPVDAPTFSRHIENALLDVRSLLTTHETLTATKL